MAKLAIFSTDTLIESCCKFDPKQLLHSREEKKQKTMLGLGRYLARLMLEEIEAEAEVVYFVIKSLSSGSI